MISIEEGLYHKLTNTAAITAIVSSRVYPAPLPQNPTLPALTYQLITPMSMTSHQGMGGTAFPRYQITGWASTLAALVELMKQVRICLNGFKGTFGTGGSTVTVQSSLMAGGYDTYEPDTQRYMRAQDYIIYHAEDIT